MWIESRSVSCYGPVTVAAQWNAQGDIRLIQIVKGSNGIGWKGRVYYRPADDHYRQYFNRVFNLIAHSEAGFGEQKTEERTFPTAD